MPLSKNTCFLSADRPGCRLLATGSRCFQFVPCYPEERYPDLLPHKVADAAYHPAVDLACLNALTRLLGFGALPYLVKGLLHDVPERQVHDIAWPDIPVRVYIEGVGSHGAFELAGPPVHLVKDPPCEVRPKPVLWMPGAEVLAHEVHHLSFDQPLVDYLVVFLVKIIGIVKDGGRQLNLVLAGKVKKRRQVPGILVGYCHRYAEVFDAELFKPL